MPHTIPAASSAESPAADVDVTPEHFRIVIIGSGFSGLGMAVALRRAGINDFVILERGQDVGGTWRDNTYPGCGCDVPSQLYSFSFAQNPEWTRSFSLQPEIFAYLRKVADDFDLRTNLRTDHEVLEANWDEQTRLWTVVTPHRTFTANYLISGAGALADPTIPDVEGLDDFTGEIFHSAVWNHDVDLTGKRVAVIGTGASVIQFVPKIAGTVEALHILQRTPPWILPRADRAITGTERKVFRRVPALQKVARGGVYGVREMAAPIMTYAPVFLNAAARLARLHMNKAVKDPQLRRVLTPAYRIGCKRILLSNDYYPALARENVEVLDSGLASLTPSGVVTSDGREREVDVVIFGTGFAVNEQPIAERLFGREGRPLADKFRAEGANALRGSTVAGYPNLFMIIGPNTGLGHTSMIYMIESQIAYVMDAIRTIQDLGITRIEPKPKAVKRWNEVVQGRLRRSVWNTGGCSSWYLDANGDNTTLWPGSTMTFRRAMRQIDVTEYALSTKIRTSASGGRHADAAQTSADQIPADQIPADQIPADQIPADQIPADQVPATPVAADDYAGTSSEA